MRPHTVRRPRLALGDGVATRVSRNTPISNSLQRKFVLFSIQILGLTRRLGAGLRVNRIGRGHQSIGLTPNPLPIYRSCSHAPPSIWAQNQTVNTPVSNSLQRKRAPFSMSTATIRLFTLLLKKIP